MTHGVITREYRDEFGRTLKVGTVGVFRTTNYDDRLVMFCLPGYLEDRERIKEAFGKNLPAYIPAKEFLLPADAVGVAP